MGRRIKLDQDYINRVRTKKVEPIVEEVIGLGKKELPCHFCGLPTIHKYEDLHGHFDAKCDRCGQIGTYNADYRRYSYVFTAIVPVSTMASNF